MPVSTVVALIVPLRELKLFFFVSKSSSPLKSLKLPVTFVIIICFTLKPTLLCPLSRTNGSAMSNPALTRDINAALLNILFMMPSPLEV